MNIKILDGNYISNVIINDVKRKFKKVINLKKFIGIPFVSIIVIGNNVSSEIYVKNKIKKAIDIGYKTKVYKFVKDIKEIDVIKLIKKLNKDNFVHGILVQLPLPKNINTFNIVSKINLYKDVDCLNPYNFGKLCYKKSIFKPCAVYGIIILLKKYNLLIKGSHAVIIGTSNLIGKPIYIELINHGYTVTIINKNFKLINLLIKTADLLIIAVGIPNFISLNNLKENSIVIDVGINRLKNGKIVGDVNKDNTNNKLYYITPVPGGIGPITISVLLHNILKAFIINNKLY